MRFPGGDRLAGARKMVVHSALVEPGRLQPLAPGERGLWLLLGSGLGLRFCPTLPANMFVFINSFSINIVGLADLVDRLVTSTEKRQPFHIGVLTSLFSLIVPIRTSDRRLGVITPVGQRGTDYRPVSWTGSANSLGRQTGSSACWTICAKTGRASESANTIKPAIRGSPWFGAPENPLRGRCLFSRLP